VHIKHKLTFDRCLELSKIQVAFPFHNDLISIFAGRKPLVILEVGSSKLLDGLEGFLNKVSSTFLSLLGKLELEGE